jgi:hypothetical protein
LLQDDAQVLPLSELVAASEAPRDAALRAVLKTTNLDANLDDLVYFRRYPESHYYFTLHFVPGHLLKIKHPYPITVMHDEAAARRLNLVAHLRRALTDYYHERRKLA